MSRVQKDPFYKCLLRMYCACCAFLPRSLLPDVTAFNAETAETAEKKPMEFSAISACSSL